MDAGQSQEDIKNSFIALYPDKSFAVGTPSVPYDMTANIHQGEIIVPKNFSDGLRNGDLQMGSQAEVVTELKKLNSKVEKLEKANEAMAFYQQQQLDISVRAAQAERIAV